MWRMGPYPDHWENTYICNCVRQRADILHLSCRLNARQPTLSGLEACLLFLLNTKGHCGPHSDNIVSPKIDFHRRLLHLIELNISIYKLDTSLLDNCPLIFRNGTDPGCLHNIGFHDIGFHDIGFHYNSFSIDRSGPRCYNCPCSCRRRLSRRFAASHH